MQGQKIEIKTSLMLTFTEVSLFNYSPCYSLWKVRYTILDPNILSVTLNFTAFLQNPTAVPTQSLSSLLREPSSYQNNLSLLSSKHFEGSLLNTQVRKFGLQFNPLQTTVPFLWGETASVRRDRFCGYASNPLWPGRDLMITSSSFLLKMRLGESSCF